jgi:hypothetical protein
VKQLGGFCRAKEEFNGAGAVVSYLSDKGDNTMKLTTIALAIACALPSTFALARGGMGMGMGGHFGHSFAATRAAGRIANRPRNVSGNALGPIAHDPSGSTLTGTATSRGG